MSGNGHREWAQPGLTPPALRGCGTAQESEQGGEGSDRSSKEMKYVQYLLGCVQMGKVKEELNGRESFPALVGGSLG